MNLRIRSALLLSAVLLLSPCLRAQDTSRSSALHSDLIRSNSSPQDTSAAPPDFVNVDQMPKIISQSIPVYPEKAKKAGIEGRVIVKLWIDTKGDVRKAILLKSTDEIFDKPSLDAAMKYRFSPAVYRDSPVSVWVVIPFTYKLKPDSGEVAGDTTLAGKYRKEMIDAIKASESYQEAIKKYDAAMYFERKNQQQKALKLYREFLEQIKEFPNSPEEMVRYARMMVKKYSATEVKHK